MESVMVVDAIRTPMGRSKGGIFRHIRAEDLSAHLMHHLLTRHPTVDAAKIDDIYWGCVQQTGEQGMNIARNAALLAGLPYHVPAVSVNRLCGSSMEALHDASRAIQVGDAHLCLIGGVEHMGHIPMDYGIDIHPGLNKRVAKGAAVMGLTAELVGRMYQISREQQDQFALRSHQRASIATQSGAFKAEIIATEGHDNVGGLACFQQDEVIRMDAELATLHKLKPVFDPLNGTVTAGNASALSDGAAAMLLMSQSHCQDLGIKPRAKVRAMAVVGCEPSVMGLGVLPATELALKRAGLSLSDIDVIELNEAFAAQALACLKALKLLDCLDEKVNLHGGAIALGHPLGCSGARISTTLLHIMEKKDAQFGLATMCIGLGQGITTIFERI